MYPSHMHLYTNNPYNQEAKFYSTPSHDANYYHTTLNERQFGTSFPQMGPPQGPPGFPPPGQSPEAGQPTAPPPSAPPPSFVPAQTQQAATFAVDPGSIRRCLFRYTYVWLRNFQQFWFYPTFVGRTSVAGWRWTGNRWVYFGISLRQIQSFTCF